MTWTSISPKGNLSVKANRTTMAANTAYIETKLGNSAVGTNTTSTRDHFWNVSGDLDGRHRFIQSPRYTSTAVAPNAVNPQIGTLMDGVLYCRLVNASVGRVEYFWRNTSGIYQVTPSYVTGSVANVNATAQNFLTVPQNVYGEIFMFRSGQNGDQTFQMGYFKSSTTAVNAFAIRNTNSSGNEVTTLRFGGGSGGDSMKLTVRVNSSTPEGNTWQYRVTYRAQDADG